MLHVMRLLAVGLALALAAPPAARAHPHVFIDSGVDFLFDAQGRLSHLRITWLYDHLSTLFLLEDLGLAPVPETGLDDAAAAAVARDQTQWIDGYDGDATLHHAGRRIELSRPIEPQAAYRDGQVEIRFLRALDEPIVPDAQTVAKVYDPTYFIAYFVTYEPQLENAPEGCSARVEPFEPTAPLLSLQQTLFALAPDEDPEEEVGQLFADRISVACP
jgi:ABC-type uncharacterized transport system substrate-binding protein